MTTTTKAIITVVVTTAVVSLLGYFFGFAMLFAHTMSEIFWYGLLYGGTNMIALSVLGFFESRDSKESKTKSNTQSSSSKTVATT